MNGRLSWPWVAGWLHTGRLHNEINVWHRELNPDTVAHLSTNRARRWLTPLIKANTLTTTPDHQLNLCPAVITWHKPGVSTSKVQNTLTSYKPTYNTQQWHSELYISGQLQLVERSDHAAVLSRGLNGLRPFQSAAVLVRGHFGPRSLCSATVLIIHPTHLPRL